MDILMLTNSCSSRKYNAILGKRTSASVDPQQKYFRLMAEGLAQNRNVSISVLSVLPVSASSYPQRFFPYESEVENNVFYEYLPFVNGKILRYVCIFFNSFFLSLKWCIKHKGKDAAVICDPLTMIASVPCRFVAHCFRIKTVAIITDIPSLVNSKKDLYSGLKLKLNDWYGRLADTGSCKYDYYVTLTESINERLNPKKKPHTIVEGLSDSRDIGIEPEHGNYIMYAGGVFEIFGVKNLVEAFIRLNRKDIELHIYGSGTYVDELIKIGELLPNVKYKGCVSPEEIVLIEKKALFLINPRPVKEEFSKYSFPSKTIEYMLSGTPVLSTKLPGIPPEYFNYLYVIDPDNVDGIHKTLQKVLSLQKKDIKQKGQEAHNFVISQKNNVIMSSKIIDLIQR